MKKMLKIGWGEDGKLSVVAGEGEVDGGEMELLESGRDFRVYLSDFDGIVVVGRDWDEIKLAGMARFITMTLFHRIEGCCDVMDAEADFSFSERAELVELIEKAIARS